MLAIRLGASMLGLKKLIPGSPRKLTPTAVPIPTTKSSLPFSVSSKPVIKVPDPTIRLPFGEMILDITRLASFA